MLRGFLTFAVTVLLAACSTQGAKEFVAAQSGLKYADLKKGIGAEAVQGSTVSVHYTGWLYENGTRGKKFDSSRDGDGRPFLFRLGAGEVIAGWDEGVKGMKVGGKRELIIPPQLGYGARGSDPIPPNATLDFEVELLNVSR